MSASRTLQQPEISRPASADEWDRIVGVGDDATVFHTRAWAEVTAATPNPALAGRTGRARAWYIRFGDGAEAVLPSVAYTFVRRCFRFHQTGPGATYGGWIGNETFGPDHETAAWNVLPWSNFELRRNPYRRRDIDRITRRSVATYPDVTYTLDLRPGYDAIEADWRRRKAQVWINARRGEKNGIRVVEASSEADWREFYTVYEENSKRWAAPLLHPLASLLGLRTRLGDRAHLWLGLQGDRIVAGEVAFVHRRHMAGLIRAALPEGYKANAPALVDVHTVRHYCERGLRWFDMDASGDNEGAIRHKLSFGATALDASLDVYRSRGYMLLRRLIVRRSDSPAFRDTNLPPSSASPLPLASIRTSAASPTSPRLT
jgi:hypothetical protein